jgi:hypothetical protein
MEEECAGPNIIICRGLGGLRATIVTAPPTHIAQQMDFSAHWKAVVIQ